MAKALIATLETIKHLPGEIKERIFENCLTVSTFSQSVEYYVANGMARCMIPVLLDEDFVPEINPALEMLFKNIPQGSVDEFLTRPKVYEAPIVDFALSFASDAARRRFIRVLHLETYPNPGNLQLFKAFPEIAKVATELASPELSRVILEKIQRYLDKQMVRAFTDNDGKQLEELLEKGATWKLISKLGTQSGDKIGSFYGLLKINFYDFERHGMHDEFDEHEAYVYHHHHNILWRDFDQVLPMLKAFIATNPDENLVALDKLLENYRSLRRGDAKDAKISRLRRAYSSCLETHGKASDKALLDPICGSCVAAMHRLSDEKFAQFLPVVLQDRRFRLGDFFGYLGRATHYKKSRVHTVMRELRARDRLDDDELVWFAYQNVSLESTYYALSFMKDTSSVGDTLIDKNMGGDGKWLDAIEALQEGLSRGLVNVEENFEVTLDEIPESVTSPEEPLLDSKTVGVFNVEAQRKFSPAVLETLANYKRLFGGEDEPAFRLGTVEEIEFVQKIDNDLFPDLMEAAHSLGVGKLLNLLCSHLCMRVKGQVARVLMVDLAHENAKRYEDLREMQNTGLELSDHEASDED